MTQSLQTYYHDRLKTIDGQPDGDQSVAINHLQSIYDALVHTKPHRPWFTKQLYTPVKGLYLWGGVGRGKTFIMDLFFDYLGPIPKSRLHFSHFMQRTHRLLNRFHGQKNPINRAAYLIAKKARVICFDEFYVEDIADAMILGNLFTALFKFGVTLVATSNIPPDRLYLGGLQRESFLPAIEQIKQNVTIQNLDAGVDYRQVATHLKNYFFPLDESEKQLQNRFAQLTGQTKLPETGQTITLMNRTMPIFCQTHNALWMDGRVLCGPGRGVDDYIALANMVQYLFISYLPILDQFHEDMARRFIALIDECYDRRVTVIISADAIFYELYQGKRLSFPFQRTISRLNEMQSWE